MKNFFFSALLCALFSLSATAQSNYRSGYIIKANGDTVKGYIDYREWGKSPRAINFKESVNDSRVVEYNSVALKSFQVTGYDNYVSYAGPVTTGKVSTTELPAELDISTRLDTVFLKMLSTGPNVTLLYHVDNIKRRYFIMERGQQPIELKYYAYLNTRNFVVETFEFRDQLAALIQKYVPGSIISNQLKQVSYSNDLIKYIHIINGNIYENEATSTSTTRFFVGGGIAYNITNFNGPDKFNYQKQATSIAPVITLGLDILPNKNIQKYFTRVEISFNNRTGTFTGAAGYYNMKVYSVGLTPQFILNLYNKSNFKFFIAGGLGFRYNSSAGSKLVATDSGIILTPYASQTKGESFVSLKQGDQIKDPYPISTATVNIQAKTGLIINKKVEIFLSAIPVSFLEAKENPYSYNSFSLAFGLNYFLSK